MRTLSAINTCALACIAATLVLHQAGGCKVMFLRTAAGATAPDELSISQGTPQPRDDMGIADSI